MDRRYIFKYFDDFFAIFTGSNNVSKQLFIPRKMINVPLQKGDLVEIQKLEQGYIISVLEQ